MVKPDKALAHHAPLPKDPARWAPENHWSLEENRRPEHWWGADIWMIASTR
jgi:hypothetical protein